MSVWKGKVELCFAVCLGTGLDVCRASAVCSSSVVETIGEGIVSLLNNFVTSICFTVARETMGFTSNIDFLNIDFFKTTFKA
jgi:hypothetical protein